MTKHVSLILLPTNCPAIKPSYQKLYPNNPFIMSSSEVFRKTNPNPTLFVTPKFGLSGDQIKPDKCVILNPLIAEEKREDKKIS